MRLLFAVLFCVMVLPNAFAEKLPAPTGKPVLTISGLIGNTNVGDTAVFDLAALEKLGMETIVTTTPWYSGKVRFEGVSLSKLMDLVGARGKTAKVIALNDYTTMVPLDDFRQFPVILALKLNGEYMHIRDKGPLFIVYPYDSSPELQNQVYYSRSAWQVSKIIIE
ncbi:molybdopterin-dependent oxidoreductase [Raoultella planticola]|uniref:molybdopterin-dependent oxidoreductase n=1 Tax=Raoultella planticola TaxID=575 RepID=UPI0017801050|nr:molybdopterin-dependent oxidoreductase [Raoultella planticola]MBE0091862.1 molybdopterin-dependent oxidoreductase [Raoultella planticola]